MCKQFCFCSKSVNYLTNVYLEQWSSDVLDLGLNLALLRADSWLCMKGSILIETGLPYAWDLNLGCPHERQILHPRYNITPAQFIQVLWKQNGTYIALLYEQEVITTIVFSLSTHAHRNINWCLKTTSSSFVYIMLVNYHQEGSVYHLLLLGKTRSSEQWSILQPCE